MTEISAPYGNQLFLRVSAVTYYNEETHRSSPFPSFPPSPSSSPPQHSQTFSNTLRYTTTATAPHQRSNNPKPHLFILTSLHMNISSYEHLLISTSLHIDIDIIIPHHKLTNRQTDGRISSIRRYIIYFSSHLYFRSILSH